MIKCIYLFIRIWNWKSGENLEIANFYLSFHSSIKTLFRPNETKIIMFNTWYVKKKKLTVDMYY